MSHTIISLTQYAEAVVANENSNFEEYATRVWQLNHYEPIKDKNLTDEQMNAYSYLVAYENLFIFTQNQGDTEKAMFYAQQIVNLANEQFYIYRKAKEYLENADRSSWDYKHATDLIRELKESGEDFCIGGACYPEIHPESENQREDIKYLKEKVDAGCSFLTTQMFFDNNLLYNFLYKIREAGITVPVIPGIMPITNANQVDRAIKLSGSFMPQRFKSLVDKFGHSPEAMKQAGIAYATDQIIDLFANGIANVHVYSMNKPDVAQKIQSNLSEIIK